MNRTIKWVSKTLCRIDGVLHERVCDTWRGLKRTRYVRLACRELAPRRRKSK